MTAYIIMAIIAYAIGSINFAVIFSRKIAGFDVREKGSKNAGTTNMLRTVGKKAALITLLCDIAKGIVAILIAMLIAKIWEGLDANLLKYIAGFMAILGHTFPIFFEFRGGKGVATSIGVLLLLDWKIGLACVIFGVIIIAITKMVSVGSLLAAILFPILTVLMQENLSIWSILISFLIAILVIFNHRANIERIKNGTENKLSFKK